MTGTPARRRATFILGFAILLIALLAIPRLGRPQQQADQAQQMQQFNSLPPDQQQAILQRMGGQGGATGTGGFGIGGPGNPNVLGGGALNGSQAALQQQYLLQLQRQQQAQLEGQTLIPVFKPGDTVLVEIGIPSYLRSSSPQDNGQIPAQDQMLNNAAPMAGAPLPGALLPNGMPVPGTPVVPSTAQQPQAGVGSSGGGGGMSVQQNVQRSAEELQSDELHRLRDMIQEIRAHNPYQLDGDGVLHLPGIPGMALAGLTEDLATRRAAAEPAFAKLQIRLTRLPLAKAGQEALKPFGYDLFKNSSLAFMPMLQVPVPAEYVVGAGDVLQVQLFGSQNQTLSLIVSRDGKVSFPQLGPIVVGGRRYSEVKSEIEARVAKQLIGVRASVSMTETRAINVFVLGGAKYPGSYTVSGLATVTTALFAAGGVDPIGSLRGIQVKRQGEIVRSFDLYDLLMRGDSSSDITLLPGDVVFIPPVGATVALYGEVQRPAIYELKGNDSAADVIRMGGGLKPDADPVSASLVRVDEQQRRIVIDVNPSAPTAALLQLHNGDALHVARLLPQLDSGVILQGYVYRPKYVAWHEGLRLSEVVHSVDDLKTNADQHYLLIRRELPPNRTIAVLSADLTAALHAPGSAADVVLMPRDTITAFDLQTSREHIIHPLMEELRLQSNLAAPTEIVHIDGRVKVPGDYPLEPGMRVSDLIRAGGSLDPAAYGVRAELSRYTVDSGGQRDTHVISIDLAAVRRGDLTADIALQPFDRLSIKQVTGWAEQDQVTLRGEVRFPGIYSIQPGETLHSVINRAGGLTQYAFVDGSLFTRVELKIREQEQMDRLAERLRTEIAEVALMGVRAQYANPQAAISISQTLLDQLTSAKAVGRLVINLRALLRTKVGSSDDVILRNGDELIVPKQRQEVMVLGEVQDPTSHLYKHGMTRDDYIEQSGGPTTQADRSRIYVVRADGTVDSGHRGWFSASESVEIHPGDAIVVPLNTERLPAMALWTAVSTILFNIGIAAATARSVY